MSFVSIITATYNNERFMAETIESVLSQTYSDFEYIIVDDGSTDKTASIIRSFQDERIKYVFQENTGIPAVGRNTGIKHSSGELVAFIDHDDLWLPTKLEKQVKFLEEHPDYGMVYCDFEVFETETGKVRYRTGEVLSLHAGYVADYLIQRNFIGSLAPVLRKSVIEDVGLFDESRELRFVEDWELWLRVAANYQIGFVNEVLARYRLHASNSANQLNLSSHLRNELLVFEKAIQKSSIYKKNSSKNLRILLEVFPVEYLKTKDFFTCQRTLFSFCFFSPVFCFPEKGVLFYQMPRFAIAKLHFSLRRFFSLPIRILRKVVKIF